MSLEALDEALQLFHAYAVVSESSRMVTGRYGRTCDRSELSFGHCPKDGTAARAAAADPEDKSAAKREISELFRAGKMKAGVAKTLLSYGAERPGEFKGSSARGAEETEALKSVFKNAAKMSGKAAFKAISDLVSRGVLEVVYVQTAYVPKYGFYFPKLNTPTVVLIPKGKKSATWSRDGGPEEDYTSAEYFLRAPDPEVTGPQKINKAENVHIFFADTGEGIDMAFKANSAANGYKVDKR